VAHIRRVPRKEARLSCDYECSPRVSVVFVTLQFHQSRPDYAAMRMGLVDRNKYAVRLLIVQVNIEVPQDALLELTAVSLQQGHTLVCAQSAQEAAQYLELLCTLEKSEEAHSGAFSTLLGRPEPGVGVAADLLRSVRGMTKNGIAGLLQTLGSLAGVATAEVDQLCAVPGVGAKRAQKLHAIMRQPFHRPAGKSNKRKPS
jgi:DNA repair protein Rad10